MLAFVNLVTETQLDESIVLLRRVLATSPGRTDLLFTLAQVYMRKQDFKTARQILERLGHNNGDQHLRQQAQSLLKQLDGAEEQFARFEASRKTPGASGGSARTLVNEGDTIVIVDRSPADPASYLRAALRKPGEDEKQVQAALMRIDCDALGIIFSVRIDGRLVRLRTDRFENVNLTSFSADAGREITCGPRKPEDAIVICYVPLSDARNKVDGTIKSIEFVPKDFKLTP